MASLRPSLLASLFKASATPCACQVTNFFARIQKRPSAPPQEKDAAVRPPPRKERKNNKARGGAFFPVFDASPYAPVERG